MHEKQGFWKLPAEVAENLTFQAHRNFRIARIWEQHGCVELVRRSMSALGTFREVRRRKNDGFPVSPWLSRENARLRSGQIQQHQVGAFLHSFEDNFAAVRREIEVAHVEVGRKARQLPLGPRVKIDEPQILVLNLSPKEDEGPASRQEGEVPSAARQGQCRQEVRGSFGCHRF
jgi:hypothetical protein